MDLSRLEDDELIYLPFDVQGLRKPTILPVTCRLFAFQARALRDGLTVARVPLDRKLARCLAERFQESPLGKTDRRSQRLYPVSQLFI